MIKQKTIIISTVIFGWFFLGTPGAWATSLDEILSRHTNNQCIVGTLNRSLAYQGVNPDGVDPNWVKACDEGLMKRYYWKTSCELLLGNFSEDTWHCSWDNHFSSGYGNGTENEYVAFLNKLHQRALENNWENPERYKSVGGNPKLDAGMIFMCEGDGNYWDPFVKAPCIGSTWSLEEKLCKQAGTKSEYFIYNRRTKQCVSKNDPCKKLYLTWDYKDWSGSEQQQFQNQVNESYSRCVKNNTNTTNSASSGTNTEQKEDNHRCVETIILGENNAYCDDANNDGSGLPQQLINGIATTMAYGVGIMGITGITVTGIQYLTAGGNEEKTRKAKRRMAEVVLGVALYATLYTLINWLNP